jgi:hypothetical protein
MSSAGFVQTKGVGDSLFISMYARTAASSCRVERKLPRRMRRLLSTANQHSTRLQCRTGSNIGSRVERVTVLRSHPNESRITLGGRWTEARWLRLGDQFLTKTGHSATVVGLCIRIERIRVYNLNVDRLHSYAVGDGAGVLVHNNCPGEAWRLWRKGRAPRGIKRIDKPDTNIPGSQYHAHDRRGGALNRDGSFHDAPPGFTNRTLRWLKEHGWTIPDDLWN